MSSERSAGKMLTFRGRCGRGVIERPPDAFEGIDAALFSAGTAVSRDLGRMLAEREFTVIDNSRAFRMESDVPLVVPEVNPDDISSQHLADCKPELFNHIQLVVAHYAARGIAPLHRVVTSTYQSASGGGRAAMDELRDQTVDLLNFRSPKVEHFSRRLALSVLPQIDAFAEDGFTLEEHKMINETRKIHTSRPSDLRNLCTRTGFVGYALSVNVEFDAPFDMNNLADALSNQSGLGVRPEQSEFPTAADASGVDDVFVGRVRRDPSVPHGAVMWVVAR